ncbi:unnamed protein product [Strongylus vulgaris]|uniref:Uncharacterized protein n=1 Tax=Strongylus vulgaris TaxID=40348 RepID=A0A3P7IDI3_STRVU|nr:unnamed protein product [Strongylus vulgaris]
MIGPRGAMEKCGSLSLLSLSLYLEESGKGHRTSQERTTVAQNDNFCPPAFLGINSASFSAVCQSFMDAENCATGH